MKAIQRNKKMERFLLKTSLFFLACAPYSFVFAAGQIGQMEFFFVMIVGVFIYFVLPLLLIQWGLVLLVLLVLFLIRVFKNGRKDEMKVEESQDSK